MASASEIAEAVQNGQTDVLELWWAVRRFAMQQANRWHRATEGGGGVTMDDFEQVAFLALLDALGRWSPGTWAFNTVYGGSLKNAFAEVTGLRRERDKQDPINTAISIDAPLACSVGEPFTIADFVPDVQAEAAFEAIEAVDLQTAIRAALATLTPEQRQAIIGEFWFGRKSDTKTRNAAFRALRHPSVSSKLMVFLR